jgi:NAD(P)-dependent dehydrogenase (short-subunit alcohol dehydrogenase family)
MLGARNPELGHKAAAELSEEKIDARFVELDVEREKIVQNAAATIAREFERLDILVNNAGIVDRADGPPSTTELDAVERTLRTRLVQIRPERLG